MSDFERIKRVNELRAKLEFETCSNVLRDIINKYRNNDPETIAKITEGEKL